MREQGRLLTAVVSVVSFSQSREEDSLHTLILHGLATDWMEQVNSEYLPL